MKDIPLNQILYGPPGTGKTYQTVNRAVEILDPEFYEGHKDQKSLEARKALKERFDDLRQEGRIVQVTFHQSFSYEDFVEGLKASSEDGQINYDIENGVFKEICNIHKSIFKKTSGMEIDTTNRTVWKMSLGKNDLSEAHIYKHCIENDEIRLGHGGPIDFSKCEKIEDIKDITAKRKDDIKLTDKQIGMVNIFKNQMKIGDLVVATKGEKHFRAIGEISGEYFNVPYEGHYDDFSQFRPVIWHRVWNEPIPYDQLNTNQFSRPALYNLTETVKQDRLAALLGLPDNLDMSKMLIEGTIWDNGDKIVEVNEEIVCIRRNRSGTTINFRVKVLKELAGYIDNGKSEIDDIKNKRVLIIDEINRGNISSIFGELITLIEQDKRKGNREELEVRLPYSKDTFSVPNDLYIIGTMNTADRSLALLDTALRRRFEFEEVPPDPRLLDEETEEVEGVDISQLLETMNKRIEALYNRDHLLGHSFFMGLDNNSTIADLRRIFERHVLPTLEEYFFEDWGKIRKVLGDHLKKEQKQQFIIPRFEEGELKRLLGDDHESEDEERHFRRNESALDDPAAYIGIYAPE